MASILIATDNIDGNATTDGERLAKAVTLFEQAGHTVQNCGIGPNNTQRASQSNPSDIMIQIGGGKCLGTLIDFYKGKGSYYKCPQAGFLYYKCWDPNWKAVRAHDDNFSNASDIAQYAGKTLPEIFATMDGMFYGYGDTIEDCVSTFLANWSGQNIAGASGGANVVEGELYSHEGETPEFWNVEQYSEYIRVDFTNFTIEEVNPRIRTASFETPENIDLTEGRVAVLITGDCNDFGGIIIKKTHDSKTGLFKYQCQGFMERIMTSPVYVVANGGRTAHNLIRSYLSKVGLPDVNLGDPEDYDILVDEETLREMEADEDLAETAELLQAKEDLKKAIEEAKKKKKKKDAKKKEEAESKKTDSSSSSTKKTTTSDSSSSSSDSDSDSEDETETEEEDDAADGIVNTFKRKPVGIYDKKTGGDYIRTMIFDYGINVDFYGDVNGIPHFDIMDMDTWKRTGWYISPDMGFEGDYEYNFDITDIVTQVGVKNVSAINGNGELYTSKELLGVDLERFVGRLGTIIDNPNARAGGGTGTGTATEEYQDAEGNKYTPDQVLSTNGEPSCNNCKSANGDSQPTQQKYQKYWVNKCPGCEEEGKLKSTDDVHGKTECENCQKTYCQYCGTCRDNASYKLTEVFKVQTTVTGTGVATGTGTMATSGTGTSSGSSGSSSGGSSYSGSSSSKKKTSSKKTAYVGVRTATVGVRTATVGVGSISGKIGSSGGGVGYHSKGQTVKIGR